MQAANPPTLSLRERLTTQPPLMWISLAFLAGIVLASLVPLSREFWVGISEPIPVGGLYISVWGILSIAFLLLAFSVRFFSPSPKSTFPSFAIHPFSFILLTALSLGAARYQYTVPHFDAFHIAFYNDRDYELLITGTLVEPPDYRDDYTNLRIEVSAVDTGDSELPAHGLILVRVPSNQTYQYGDVIRLRGKLKTPP